MTLPVSLSLDLMFPRNNGHGHIGPYRSSSNNFYVFLVNSDAVTGNDVRVIKAIDPDTAWTEIATESLLGGSDIYHLATHVDSGKDDVFIFGVGPTGANGRVFDMGTDTFTDVFSPPVTVNSDFNDCTIAVARRNVTSDTVILYSGAEDDVGGLKQRVDYAVYAGSGTGAGSWIITDAAIDPGGALNFTGPTAERDALNDTIQLSYYNVDSVGVFKRSITAGDSITEEFSMNDSDFVSVVRPLRMASHLSDSTRGRMKYLWNNLTVLVSSDFEAPAQTVASSLQIKVHNDTAIGFTLTTTDRFGITDIVVPESLSNEIYKVRFNTGVTTKEVQVTSTAASGIRGLSGNDYDRAGYHVIGFVYNDSDSVIMYDEIATHYLPTDLRSCAVPTQNFYLGPFQL